MSKSLRWVRGPLSRPVRCAYLPLALLLVACLLAWAQGAQQAAAPKTTETMPLPEYYGIYAVVEGELVKLDSEKVKVKRTVPVRIGWRNAVGNILKGEAVAGSTERHVPEFSPNLKIIVYQQAGLVSPMNVAESLHLEELLFVRNVSVDTGWPNHVRRSGQENGWDAGDAPELLGLSRGDRAEALEFLVKPVSGQQDMVLAVLPRDLRPGVYRLSVGPRDPLLGSEGFMFAVSPVSEGETQKCVDAQVKYAMMISDIKFTPCAPPGQPPGPQPPHSRPLLCPDYDSCLKSSVAAFQARRWDESLSYAEEASRLAPERGEAWAMIGGVYFERAEYDQAWQMADKALSLGAALGAKVCRERFGGCEQGTLILSNKEVALIDKRNKKVFSAPPSQVTSRQATLYSQASAAYSWLTVAGKNYRLYLIPEAVQCQIDLAVICPEPGFTQQKVFANYVHHAIQGLASGALAKPPESSSPPSPTSQPPVVPGGTLGEFRHGTKDCARRFGSGWDDRCLLERLRDLSYFGISTGDVPDQQLLDYIKTNQEEIATLLLQIDYGRDIQRFVTNQDRILLAENERAFVETLGRAGTITQILGQVANVLNTLQQTAAWTAASESLSALRQILFGIRVYERAAQIFISQGMRTVLDTYFYYRRDSTREAAWREIITTRAFDRPLLQMSMVKQIPMENLNEWFENAYVAYRLVAFPDSDQIRHAQGLAIAHLAGGSNWQELWEGSVRGPGWTEPVRMVVRRNSDELRGAVTFGRFGPLEMKGKIDAQDKFVLKDWGGGVWEGRVSSDIVSGVRPNGPPDDPNVARFPFELKRLRPISDTELPGRLPPTSSDWNTFYTRFKEAVRRRDRTTLRALMARNFSYAGHLNPSAEHVFAELDYGGGANWTILERTLALGTQVGRDSPLGRPTRVAKNPLPCGREPCLYQVWVIFEQDDDGQWRWAGMEFPGD